MVGTPDYIAPEGINKLNIVFGREGGKSEGYGNSCDWWSLGCILYECLIGHAPFCDPNPRITYLKIMDFVNQLNVPVDHIHSEQSEQLIVGYWLILT
jgi:protein-serine/threonine kinase